MTGMERNSDVVAMASYAPLFVNMNHRAWNPDLINFDSSRWYGLPSYYVQQMFSLNRGDATVPVEVNSPRREIETSKGKIGVGTWNTEAEFKDIKVTSPDGKTLFASDFSTNLDGWEQLGGGHWEIADGAMRQNAEKEFIRALAGSPSWTDYTLTLKARKLGGREGFLILFHIINDEDRVWWNLGGWQNTQDALENGGVIDPKPGYIGENHWYNIRVEVSGKHVKCYLDGQLVHDLNYESEQRVAALYSSATRDEKTGDLIVKAVNVSAGPLKTQINLFGAKNLTGQGAASVLTSANASDENTLDDPTRVVPANETFNFTGDSLTRVLPGNSFTVFRFGTK
jgi:alpha-L-arabinofuranosidase